VSCCGVIAVDVLLSLGADGVQVCVCFARHNRSVSAATYESRRPSQPTAAEQERTSAVLSLDRRPATSLSGVSRLEGMPDGTQWKLHGTAIVLSQTAPCY